MGAAVRFETSGAVPALDLGSQFSASIDASIARARDALLELQRPEGYWQAPLEANAQMNAEFIIFNHFMQVEDPDLESRLANFLLERQQADGSWNLFKGGEGYLSYTIEAYVALKLAGMSVTDQRMAAAREWILSRGGIERAGTLARFYLAAIGQVPWRATTAVPVEITLLPNWFPINVYSLASWARGTLFALSILQALRPRVEVDNRRSALELYSGDPAQAKFRQPAGEGILSLRGIFNVADRILRSYD